MRGTGHHLHAGSSALAAVVACASAGGEAAVAAAGIGRPLGADAPEWIELLPIGEIRAPTAMIGIGPGSYRLTDPERVIAASMAGDGQLLIDTDHVSLTGGSSAAAGWIDRLEVRAASSGAGRSIWGRVAWTEQGRGLVAGRVFRRISPVFQVGKKSREVIRIDGASLVNKPAIDALAPVAASSQEKVMDLSNIARALGLAEDADEAAIVAASTAARQASDRLARIAAAAGVTATADDQGEAAVVAALGAPDPAKFVPVAAVTELQGQVAALQTATARRDAEAAVAAAKSAGKLAPALEGWGQSYAERDLPGFTAWAKDAPVVVAAGRVLATTPAKRAEGELDETEAKIAASCGVSAEAYAKTRKQLAASAARQES